MSCIGLGNPLLTEPDPTLGSGRIGAIFFRCESGSLSLSGATFTSISPLWNRVWVGLKSTVLLSVGLIFILLSSGRFQVGFWLLRGCFGLTSFFFKKNAQNIFFQVKNLYIIPNGYFRIAGHLYLANNFSIPNTYIFLGFYVGMGKTSESTKTQQMRMHTIINSIHVFFYVCVCV